MTIYILIDITILDLSKDSKLTQDGTSLVFFNEARLWLLQKSAIAEK
jgi:hypothetical protein